MYNEVVLSSHPFRKSEQRKIPTRETSFAILVAERNLFDGEKFINTRDINFVRALSQAEFYSISYRCASSYWKKSGDLLHHSCSNVPRAEREGENEGEGILL